MKPTMTPGEYLAEMRAAGLDINRHQWALRLVCDLSSALGFIEGSEMGVQWLKRELESWKALALKLPPGRKPKAPPNARNDDDPNVCSGCGAEPHPTYPCDEAASLRYQRKNL